MIRFYICDLCGNVIEKIVDGGKDPVCCGKTMRELFPGTSDGSAEKHVPVIDCTLNDEFDKVCVTVGSTLHPSEPGHHIDWIILETDKGIYRKMLKAGDTPKATFLIAKHEKIRTAYEYCNLHGLWKCEV